MIEAERPVLHRLTIGPQLRYFTSAPGGAAAATGRSTRPVVPHGPLLVISAGSQTPLFLRAFDPEERDPLPEELVWTFWYLAAFERPEELRYLGWRIDADLPAHPLPGLTASPIVEAADRSRREVRIETRTGLWNCQHPLCRTGNHVEVHDAAGLRLDSGLHDEGFVDRRWELTRVAWPGPT